jgi:3-carboxy-cis,cis-muconate cycloisomerase
VRAEGLFAGIFARGRTAAEVDDRAWLQAMLDFEAALARAGARARLLPSEAAETIAAACRAERFDAAQLGGDASAAGNPVVPLLRALRAELPDDAAAHLHRGATSQDVLDTAAMLVARRALVPLLDDASVAAAACARLAEAHRDSVLVGRTLLQQAAPLTFALKASQWLVGIDEAREQLAAVAGGVLAVQLGGAVGTLSALEGEGLAVAAELARALELGEPVLPWHTVRVRPAMLAGALAVLAGALAKVARDVTLLAQGEVGEAREGGAPGRGGSSTMPHKRNPVAAVSALACAQRVPGLVATIHSAMVQEHERAAGAWQAEWETFSELLRLVGAEAAWAREMLEALEVDPERMRSNLEAAGDLVMAEGVATALAAELGRGPAHDLVEGAARRASDEGRSLREVLGELPEAAERLGPEGLDAALVPEAYLGAASELVERALAAHDKTLDPEEQR